MEHTSNIIELLKETSFPQMLLIDGSWGSGKTHYIKNELESALANQFTKHKIHYFSLYGVSSIDDFRDRLISLVLTNNTETSKFTKIAAQVVEGVATNMGERGIGGVLNGAAGAYKYKLYSELNNCILILDDLERISNKSTIKDILGECLNLAESKSVKIVVVANESKLDCQSDIEKVFIDKIKFSYTSAQVANILKEEFNNVLSPTLYNELVLYINSTGSSNIRVLKRALHKFKKLVEVISKEVGISLEIALSNTLRQVIKICYVKFELGYSSEEIKKSRETNIVQLIGSESTINSLSEREKILDTILTHEFIHDFLTDFCCEGVYKFENIVSELKLPMEISSLDKILDPSLLHRLPEDEFQLYVEQLITLINSDCNLNLNEWFNVCDTFIYFIENKYISSKHTRKSIIDICINKNVECFDFKKIPNRGYFKEFYCSEIHKLYNKKLTAIKKVTQYSMSSNFSTSFSSSWVDVDNETYQELSSKPFLQKIGVDRFIQAIKNWSSYDVYSFACYMKEKYSYSNIEDFLEDEHMIIQTSLTALENIELDPSLKLGAIEQLKEVLSDINIRMIERLTLKNK